MKVPENIIGIYDSSLHCVFQEIDVLARHILLSSQGGMLQYSSPTGVHKFLQRN